MAEIKSQGLVAYLTIWSTACVLLVGSNRAQILHCMSCVCSCRPPQQEHLKTETEPLQNVKKSFKKCIDMTNNWKVYAYYALPQTTIGHFMNIMHWH